MQSGELRHDGPLPGGEKGNEMQLTARALADNMRDLGVWDEKKHTEMTKSISGAGQLFNSWKRRIGLMELSDEKLAENLNSLKVDQAAMLAAGATSGALAFTPASFVAASLSIWAGLRAYSLGDEALELVDEADRRSRRANLGASGFQAAA